MTDPRRQIEPGDYALHPVDLTDRLESERDRHEIDSQGILEEALTNRDVRCVVGRIKFVANFIPGAETTNQRTRHLEDLLRTLDLVAERRARQHEGIREWATARAVSRRDQPTQRVPEQDRRKPELADHGKLILDIVVELREGIDIGAQAAGRTETTVVEHHNVVPSLGEVGADVLVPARVLTEAVHHQHRSLGVTGRPPATTELDEAVSGGAVIDDCGHDDPSR